MKIVSNHKLFEDFFDDIDDEIMDEIIHDENPLEDEEYCDIETNVEFLFSLTGITNKTDKCLS